MVRRGGGLSADGAQREEGGCVRPVGGDSKPVEDSASRRVAGPLGGINVFFSFPLIRGSVFYVVWEV